MSDFREHYKGRTIPFGDTGERRRLRVEKHEISRKNQRTKALDECRNLSESEEQVSIVREDRSIRLLKWKNERERQKRLEKNKKKPAFVVGIVHHKIYSPISTNEGVERTITHKKLTASSVPKKITRATEKRLKEKAVTQKTTKPTIKSTHLMVNKTEIAAKKKEESFAPVDHIFKAPAGLSHAPVFGRVLIESMSPAKITKFMSTSTKSKNSMRDSVTAVAIEDIPKEKSYVSLNKERRSSYTLEQSSMEIVPKIDSENINDQETKKNNTLLKEPRTTRNSIAEAESFADATPEKKDVSSKKYRKSSSQDQSFTASPTTIHESTNKHGMSHARSIDSSTESVALKLSSDDEKQLNSSNISSSSDKSHSTPDKNGIDIQNNESNSEGGRMNKETLNNSVTRTLSSSSNNNISLHSNSSSDPAYYSPYVVSSRGKSNARKEQQFRRGFSIGGSPRDDIPTKDTVMKNLNISVEDEERTAQYFQFLLNKEIDRLSDLCRNWFEIMEDPEIPEDAQYQINQAIGQTKLLISKKFERFRGLVQDCETGMGEMLVTCKDLQGFWDMMYMEIKDCDSRFEKLEQLRSHGWEEATQSFGKPVRRKAAAKKKAVPTKSSSIRAFMAEQRKMFKKSQNTGTDVGNDKLKNIGNSPVMQKTRRSMFLKPNDTKSTPSKQKETRFSLLQKVQLSEASKKIGSPLTIMKISQMCKTVGDCLDDSATYVNSNETPRKSILKQSRRSESCTRSTNKVNFKEDVMLNEVVIDKDAQTKKDLAVALERIDSYDLESINTEVSIRTDRKLNFDDISFEELKDVFDRTNPTLDDSTERTNDKSFSDFVQSTPLIELKSNVGIEVSKLRKSLRRQNAIDEEKLEAVPSINIIDATPHKPPICDADINMLKHKLQDQVNITAENDTKDSNESIRTLRNRSITLIPTPKSRKSLKRVSINVQEMEHKENKTPRGTRRKSSMKVGIKSSEEINTGVDSHERSDKVSKDETTEKKRSRRSVKFSDCSVCVDNKPTLPMTPHIRRSRTRQSGGEKLQLTLNKSSSLTETPARAPERIRRSTYKKVQTSS